MLRLEQLEEIASHPEAIIYVRDMQGRYVWVNDNYERLLSVSREDVIGRTNREVFGGEAANWETADSLTMVSGTFTVTEESFYDRRAGKHRRYVTTKIIIELGGQRHLAGISVEVQNADAARLEKTLSTIRGQFIDALREAGELN